MCIEISKKKISEKCLILESLRITHIGKHQAFIPSLGFYGIWKLLILTGANWINMISCWGCARRRLLYYMTIWPWLATPFRGLIFYMMPSFMNQVMADSSSTCHSDDRQTLPADQVSSGFEFLLWWLWIFESLIILKYLGDEFPSTRNNSNFSPTT